ncbi:hypothetical protein BD410DRAFT_899044 [Rickenella mellea]|uniref:F-box domain-containing protein n=1 Tax=Rickenella mellea TaxID=50990 RepID=A0A4Y7Q1Q1_9AGAM|nr:hypothetical protein BD410DRAFT_899044 [Rickenella mellea]
MFERSHRDFHKVLCDLPDELLVKVLLNLDGYSLLQAQRTNVRLCRLIRDEKALQYSSELSIAGMEDGPESAPFTVEERMARLKDYVSAWEELKCRGQDAFTVRNPSLWAVTGGLVSYGEITPKTGSTKLVFRKLQSRTRCIHGQKWMHEVPVEVQLFTADLSQDLFVFASMRPSTTAHSRTLRIAFNHISTGGSHVKAKHPFIDHEVPFEPIPSEVLVCLNYVTISCKEFVELDHDVEDTDGGETVFFVYDWLTGELKYRIKDHIQYFTFLSHKDVLFMVTHKAQQFACMLVIVDVNNQHSPDRCSVTTTLLLPELLPGSKVPDVFVHSRPRFTPMSGFATSDRVPFRTAPESRLVAITIRFYPASPYIFCVPLSTIKPFMSNESRDVSKLADCIEHGIPWEKWGAKGSSIITDAGISDVCFTWGSRCVFPSIGRRHRARYIKVCDFNPLALKRRIGTTEVQLRGGSLQRFPLLVFDPNTISKGEDFVEDVTTSLPYWVGNAGKLHAQHVLILEDHLVFVNDGGDNEDEDEVYTINIYEIS